MEAHPAEAITTNVMGTKVMADAALRHRVEKFVMVSTDKAVNPTNVMGATKRIAEIYIQSLDALSQAQNGRSGLTRFITTRFGNVLGSNGSVIPRFRDQIEKGGPVTVTHPEICRYFMTIPEACQLILEAGTMGHGGEIFIFDMGKAVKIVDLARKMIRLSGLKPDQDIKIKFTGLRPGEKIFEELLNQQENTLPTHHEKIMIAKVRRYRMEQVLERMNGLVRLIEEGADTFGLVRQMKRIVPEYISNNSEFGRLDEELKSERASLIASSEISL
jgi:FlaA1/EpsC-like NDP-sugar epimerase